jgi:hypothetical protein
LWVFFLYWVVAVSPYKRAEQVITSVWGPCITVLNGAQAYDLIPAPAKRHRRLVPTRLSLGHTKQSFSCPEGGKGDDLFCDRSPSGCSSEVAFFTANNTTCIKHAMKPNPNKKPARYRPAKRSKRALTREELKDWLAGVNERAREEKLNEEKQEKHTKENQKNRALKASKAPVRGPGIGIEGVRKLMREKRK